MLMLDPRSHATADLAPGRLPVCWEWQAFADLTPAALYAALALRADVFVVEQGCPFQDLDGFDRQAEHLFGWHALQQPERELVAYLRLIAPGGKYDEPSIGRVITARPYRKRGLGRVAMHEALARAARRYPGLPVRISAQSRLQRFYASLGFVQASAPYMEDGIPHIQMVREAHRTPS